MSKPWLTDELDKTPYFYDKHILDEIKNITDEKLQKIHTYYSVHPKFEKVMNSNENRQKRFRRSAITFLGLETDETMDIVPTKFLSADEKAVQAEQIQKLEAYQSACEMVHEYAINKNKFIDDNMLIRVHNELCSGDPDRKLKARARLRNQDDPIIMVGQGYFAPVAGEDVSKRTVQLLYDADFGWANDNFFARLAKIVVEYIRIQPHLDGNKRMAFMVMNYFLEREGYPVIYFSDEQKDELYATIEKAMITRDVTDFARFIAKTVNLCLDNTTREILDYRIQKLQERFDNGKTV